MAFCAEFCGFSSYVRCPKLRTHWHTNGLMLHVLLHACVEVSDGRRGHRPNSRGAGPSAAPHHDLQRQRGYTDENGDDDACIANSNRALSITIIASTSIAPAVRPAVVMVELLDVGPVGTGAQRHRSCTLDTPQPPSSCTFSRWRHT